MADSSRPQRRLTFALIALAGGWAGLTIVAQRVIPDTHDPRQVATIFATIVPVCVVLQLLGGRLLAQVARSHDEALASEAKYREALGEAERTLAAHIEAEKRIRFLEQVVEQAKDAILVTDAVPPGDPGPEVVYVNRAFTGLTGFSVDETIGSHPLQRTTTAPEAMRRVIDAIERQDEIEAELLVPRRDGTRFWADVSIAPLFDADGNPTHFVAMIRDVSERRELTEQLFHSQKMEAVGRLAGSIAHDFNNVLTAIRGFGELAERSVGEGRAPTIELREIRAGAERAARLTDQLLSFSRPSTGAGEETCDPTRVIRSTEGMLHRLVGDDVELDLDLAPDTPHVLIGATQLEQVLVNLVVNARDAMPDGGTLRVETALVDTGHPPAIGLAAGPHARLRICDSGVGMSPDVQARAFEPFFTTKDVGKGTGLGLSTVYAVIEHTGGRVQLESNPGSGTTFTIWLPVAAPAAVDDDSAKDDPGSALGGGETVLLVEDDDAVRTLVRTVLTRRGYQVLEAEGGESALAVAETASHIDALVTDVAMPGMRGPELAERLREELPNLRVLLVSGYSSDRVYASAPDMEFLAKPFAPDELAERLRGVLDGAVA